MTFLYKSEPVRGAIWQRIFAEQLPDPAFRTWPDGGDKCDVTDLGAWTLPDALSDAPQPSPENFCIRSQGDHIEIASQLQRIWWNRSQI